MHVLSSDHLQVGMQYTVKMQPDLYQHFTFSNITRALQNSFDQIELRLQSTIYQDAVYVYDTVPLYLISKKRNLSIPIQSYTWCAFALSATCL